MSGRTKRLVAPFMAAALLGGTLAGCADAGEPTPIYEDRTLGTELYLILCEHLSGTYYPNDVTGSTADSVCHQDQPAPADAPRLEALRKSRARLVSALDAVLAEDAYAEDELGGFMKALLPMFDKPDELLPHATRAMAAVMKTVKDDPKALAALERISGRQGYRPLANALGTITAVFRYPRLQQFLLAFTSSVEKGGVAHDSFQQLLDSIGMELAVYEPVPTGEIGSLDVARELLMSSDEQFSSGKVAPLVTRDARGFVTPASDSSMGFTDADGDGYSDVDKLGRFVANGKALAVPTPFSVLAEVEGRAKAKRDASGFAVDASGKPIYEYFDADRTLIAGMSSEIKKWSTPDKAGNSTLLGFMKGLPLVMGEKGKLSEKYAKGKLDYTGHEMDVAPLMQVLDFASLFIEAPELEEVLTLFDRFLTEHEDVAARFAKALLATKARADQDTQAHIEHPSNFWDETLTLLRRLNQRQLVPTDDNPNVDETAQESLMRAMADPGIRHMGGQIAMMGRHNVICSDGDGSDGGAATTGEFGNGQNLRYCIDINGDDINAPVAGHYGTRIDPSKPDLPSDMFQEDPTKRVQGNTSQLQAFLMLVGELMDRPLCNKKTTGAELLAAMNADACPGSPIPGGPIGGLLAIVGGAFLGDIEECGFIKVPDMGRAFGQAMMNGTGDPEKEKYGLKLLEYLNNDLLSSLMKLVPSGSLDGTFDQVFRACSGVEEFDTTPTGPALARVLFAPQGSITQIFGDKMFPPATVRPYVAGIPRDFDPMDGVDDFDINTPPANRKLATVFQGSLPVWEIQWQFGDSEPAALMNSIVPMMYALNIHDFFPQKDEDKRAAGQPYFDSEQYLFNPLVGAFAMHFPSKDSGYQSQDPNKPFFSYMSNLSSYRSILVDMLGEPDIKPNEYFSEDQAKWWNSQTNIGVFVALNDFLHTLDEMDFGDGRDGIDVFADLTKRLMNPHVYCAPGDRGYVNAEGKGACDCDRNGDGMTDAGAPAFCANIVLRKPLAYRGSNGQDYIQWELGEKYDGTDADHAWRPVAPIDLLLKALSDFDVQFDAKEDVKKPWRAARSQMIDTLFETDGTKFTNPHTVPLMRAMMTWGKAQLARHRVAPDTDAMGNPLDDAAKLAAAQEAVRDWAKTLPDRAQVFMQSPVVASALALMEDLQKDKALNDEMNQFLAHVFDAKSADEGFRTMILSIVDLLQLLRDGDNLPPVMRAVASAMVPNVRDVIEKGTAITADPSPVDYTMTFLHHALQTDGAKTLARVLSRTVTPDKRHLGGKVAPLETIIDVMAEVNRATPAAGTPLNAADIQVLLSQVSEFMEDDKRGMERVYQLMQNRFATPVQE